MELKPASDIAVAICYKLQPFCDKINIAGSIRRQKSEVKDIEVICLPKMLSNDEADLFGKVKKQYYIHPEFKSTVLSLGKILKGKADGRYMQIELTNGINLDLFMPEDLDYYRQLAIRTGNAHYAHMIIAGGWIKKGWCGSDQGLRKQHQCKGTKKPDGKTEWKCVVPNPELPPVWESEEEFFNWIGVTWIPPQRRFM